MINNKFEGVNHRQRCHFCAIFECVQESDELDLNFLENFYQKFAERWGNTCRLCCCFIHETFSLLRGGREKQFFTSKGFYDQAHKKIGIIYNQCQDNWILIYSCLGDADEVESQAVWVEIDWLEWNWLWDEFSLVRTVAAEQQTREPADVILRGIPSIRFRRFQ